MATPGGLMCKEDILGRVGPGSSGMEDRSSSVNTDSNCSLSTFALSELSGKRMPFFFKGATPGESLRVDLMYFQKGLVSPSSKGLLIMPSMKWPRALLSSLLACLLQALYRAQAWSDLAFFAFLCRCCLRLQLRLMEFVNQGTCLLPEQSLSGICNRTSSKNDLEVPPFLLYIKMLSRSSERVAEFERSDLELFPISFSVQMDGPWNPFFVLYQWQQCHGRTFQVWHWCSLPNQGWSQENIKSAWLSGFFMDHLGQMVVAHYIKEGLMGCLSMWPWVYAHCFPVNITTIEVSSNHGDGVGGHANFIIYRRVLER